MVSLERRCLCCGGFLRLPLPHSSRQKPVIAAPALVLRASSADRKCLVVVVMIMVSITAMIMILFTTRYGSDDYILYYMP